jgi:hypothetical protein
MLVFHVAHDGIYIGSHLSLRILGVQMQQQLRSNSKSAFSLAAILPTVSSIMGSFGWVIRTVQVDDLKQKKKAFAVSSLHNINTLELGNKMNAYRILIPSFTILGSVIFIH